MLKKCAITSWKGPPVGNRPKVSGTSTNWVLNTTHMYNIRADGTGSKLFYVFNKYGIKASGAAMTMTDSVASLKTAFDESFEHEYITLPVFPDDDTSQSTEDRTIPVADFCAAVSDNTSSNRSWVYYSEASKTRMWLVDYTLDQLIYLSDEGSTTSSA